MLKTDDPFKIILNSGSIGIDGFTADKFFYKHGFISELPEIMTLTFCLGFGPQKNFVNIFFRLWKRLLLETKKRKYIKVTKPPFNLVQFSDISPVEILSQNSSEIPLRESIGKISADIICPYPPGIPLVVPGEKIKIEKVDWLLEQGLLGEDLLNFYIRVVNS